MEDKGNTTQTKTGKPTGSNDIASSQSPKKETDSSSVNGNSEGNGFIDTLYKEVSGAIGGDSADQFLCLTLPGTILNPDDFKYEGGLKPAHVKANESKLVNKLFDACFVAGADNGKQLSNQYKTALSMLSPKLNKDLFELKNQLRKVLRTPYPYDFGEGLVEDMTVEQVFYRLYNDYVEAKSKWSQMQIDKKNELDRQIIDKVASHDKYLEWYGAIAESERVHLEEKLGRVLSVFSPADMDIINAILNCGVGAEVEQARSALSMVEELSPDGGYIYPVSMTPSNWYDLLDSTFTGMDLLESPAALSQKLRTLQLQRRNILTQLNNLISTIPKDEEFDKVRKVYEDADYAYKAKTQECVKNNLGATANAVSIIVDMCMKDKDNNTQMPEKETIERALNKENKDGSTVTKEDVQKLVTALKDGAIACSDAQAEAVEAGEKCTKAAIEWAEAKNRKQLSSMLAPLSKNLEEINDEIEDVKSQIIISRAAQNKNGFADEEEADVIPNKSDDFFTQILINTTMSAISTSSSKESEASSSSTHTSFFFGGYSSNSSHQKAVESAMSSDTSMSIQIGMNVAKVQIERDWFNPGVFQLTDNMFSFSENKIAPAASADFHSSDVDAIRNRFREMNQSILGSYPVAMVIAKDVSIKFTSASSMSSSFAESIEDHASKGGGFLCFSSNSSSSSSKSKSSAVANSDSKSVTVRFTAPQIIGYYMQAVPEDKSDHINATDMKDMSIVGFISDFKMMIDDLNKK